MQAKCFTVLVDHKIFHYNVWVLICLGKPAVQSINRAHCSVSIVYCNRVIIVVIIAIIVIVVWTERLIHIVKKLNLLDIFVLLNKLDAVDRFRYCVTRFYFFIEASTTTLMRTLHTNFQQSRCRLLNFWSWDLRKYVQLFFVHLLRFYISFIIFSISFIKIVVVNRFYDNSSRLFLNFSYTHSLKTGHSSLHF